MHGPFVRQRDLSRSSSSVVSGRGLLVALLLPVFVGLMVMSVRRPICPSLLGEGRLQRSCLVSVRPFLGWIF